MQNLIMHHKLHTYQGKEPSLTYLFEPYPHY